MPKRTTEPKNELPRQVVTGGNPLNQIARQIFAMAAKLPRDGGGERYQRTFTDEGLYAKERPSRFCDRVDPEQKEQWKALAHKGDQWS